MLPRSIQISFLEKVKEQIPSSISLVNELAELLNVSVDSAYRRLRGDTDLSFEEAILISNKYNVSLDSQRSVELGSMADFLAPHFNVSATSK